MRLSFIAQPVTQLGHEITQILESTERLRRIVFVSAFASLRTVLRVREQLLSQRDNGVAVRIIIGIDMGGTSKEVLEELLSWDCDTAVFKNAVPRSTFHPKLYLFEGADRAVLIVGSNNLTDGGFFTNYEAASRCEFDLPEEQRLYEETLQPLNTFLEPTGRIVQELSAELIETLVARGEVESEVQVARRRRSAARHSRESRAQDAPASPFEAVSIPFPPLLRPAERLNEASAEGEDELEEEELQEEVAPYNAESLRGVLVWQKSLSASDAQQVRAGTSPTGGVRLTQAGFENPPGERIDQTTYFRTMFANYNWEHEERGHQDQEHAFVPMRVVVLGEDLGVHNLEISHKPSGEAGQGNYTTILRWGHALAARVVAQDLTGRVLSLYETTTGDTEFYIDVTDG